MIDQEMYNDAIWLIERFLNDPDPRDPDRDMSISEFNSHKQIAAGGDIPGPTTVLEYLALVIRRLAKNKEYLDKTLEYTEKLLCHKNLSVKLYAIQVLVQIAQQKMIDKNVKGSYGSKYDKFHDLVFNLVEFVRENPEYQAIADTLCEVFYYYHEISQEEIEQLLEVLKISSKSGPLFIYFCIFNQKENKKIKRKFIDVMNNSNGTYIELKIEIAKCFYKIISKDKGKFTVIKPYINLLIKQPYEINLHYYIEAIIDQCIEDEPDLCIDWYESMLNQIIVYLKYRKTNSKDKELLALHYTETILNVISKKRPEKLKDIENTLSFLSQKGVVI